MRNTQRQPIVNAIHHGLLFTKQAVVESIKTFFQLRSSSFQSRLIFKSALVSAAAMLTAITGTAQAETWNQTLAGPFGWDTAANWTPATVPNAVGATAIINNNPTVNQTINLNIPITVGSLTIGDISGGQTVTLAPNAGNLTFDVATGNASLIRTQTGNGTTTIASNITLNDNLDVSLASGTATSTLVLSGNIGEGVAGKAITKTGATLTLTLSGANSYTGNTTITSGTLNLGSAQGVTTGPLGGGAGSLPTGSIVFGGGTLQYSAANTTDYSSKIANTASPISIDTNSQNVTFATALTSTKSGGLIKLGAGTLSLNSANSYTGGTTINAGTLQAGSTTAFGTSTGASLTFGASSTGKVQLNGNSMTVVGLTTNATVGTPVLESGSGTAGTDTLTVNNAAANIFAGVLQNGSTRTLALTKGAAGTLTLSGTNTYTGPTTISAGTLQFAKKLSLYNGTVGSWTPANITAASGATLALNVGGTNEFAAADVNTLLANISVASTPTSGLQAGSVIGFDTTTATGGTFTQGNALADSTGANGGAIGITNLGTGILVLDKTNTYTGPTTLSSGTLSVGVTANLGAPTAGLTFDGGTLQVTGTTLSSFSGIGHAVTFNATKAVGLDINNVANTFTVDQVLNQSNGSLTKLGQGTLVLNQTNTFTGGMNVNGGTVVIGAINTLAVANSVILNSAGSATTPATLDMTNFSQTLSSLSVQNTATSAANADTINIGSGQTLTINGGVTIGRNADASTTFANVSGLGTLAVNASGGTFQVGGASSGSNDNSATLDMSGLSTFTANLGTTGTFRVGDVNAAGDSANVGTSTAILAKTSTITASTIELGTVTAHSSVQTLKLGDTTNTINANTINLGSAQRGSGALSFNTGTGTLKVRATNGTSRADLNVINTTQATGGTYTASVDLSGHSSDLLLGSLAIGVRTGSSGAGGANSTFSFGTGTLDVTSIVMATKTGGGTGTSMGILNIGGGTASIGSITMASAASGQTANATINLTGGITTLAGNITKTGGVGTTSANLNLDGGTLNMGGFNIGAAEVVILNAKSGTLQNLAQLNAGGALTKTTTGVLTISGTNSYTGPTNIDDGTILVNGIIAGVANVNLGTLGGSGNGSTTGVIGGVVTIGNNIGTLDAILSPGANIGTLTTLGLLTFNSDSVFLAQVDSFSGTSDQMTSFGVTINSASTISLVDIGTPTALADGTTFTLLNNTSLVGIGGTFANLSDGGMISDGTNNYIASYSGGIDNNDLVLTVTAIPEPSTWAMLMLGGAGLCLLRRKRA